MQKIVIEVTEEEYERWQQLTEEQRSTPTWAFTRTLNDRWRILSRLNGGAITDDQAAAEVKAILH